MKICMVGFGIGKSKEIAFVGGHINNVANLSKCLADNGHEVHIVTTYPVYFSEHDDLGLHWAKVYPIMSHPQTVNGYLSNRCGLEFLLKAILKIRKLHKKENFDIIHGHSGYPITGLIPAISGKICNIPSLHTLYSPIQKKVFAKHYLSQLDAIITLSDNIKYSLKDIVPNEKIRVIPPCIDMSLFNKSVDGKQIRNNFKLNNDPTLLFLGNIKKTKGVEILVESVRMAKNRFPNIKLFMGLDMPIERYFSEGFEIKNKIESFGLKNNVIPLGIVKNMPQVMAASDIFVAPFLSTNGPADYPLSILEAMAVGKPVIVSNVGGMPEIVMNGKNGILVEPNDVNSLSEAIVSLLENKQKMEMMGKKGYDLIKDNFSAKMIAKKMGKKYGEVISIHE